MGIKEDIKTRRLLSLALKHEEHLQKYHQELNPERKSNLVLSPLTVLDANRDMRYFLTRLYFSEPLSSGCGTVGELGMMQGSEGQHRFCRARVYVPCR